MAAALPAIADAIAAVEAELVASARGAPASPAPAGAPAGDDVRALAAAAVAAVASKFLAVGTPRSLGLAGAGPIARALLAGQRAVFAHPPALRELRCADDAPGTAAALAAELGARVASLEEVCACDLVLVSSPALAARIDRAWLRGGTHVAAIDVDLPRAVLPGATIVIDDVARSGCRALDHVDAGLDAIAAGLVDGRQLDEITLFFSTAAPRLIAAVARSAGKGA